MKNIPAKILCNESFLIIDNAIRLSKNIEIQLKQIFEINDIDFKRFRYQFIQATSDIVLENILVNDNIIVSTTFTTIKSDAVEDLINAAIKHNLKNKNIFSLMQFQIVGADFEYYKEEVSILSKNNVWFYFLNKDYTTFERYE